MKIDEVAPLVGYLPEMQELHGTTVYPAPKSKHNLQAM